MFSSHRAIAGLSLIGGAFVVVIVGWGTGFFARVASLTVGLWDDFMAWLSAPMGWDHVLAGAGVLIVSIILLIIIFALADG